MDSRETRARFQELATPFETDGPGRWTEYPRPQMKRASYLSLCGAWSLSVKKDGGEIKLGTIQVPFPPESRLSGVGRAPEPGERYLYRRSFELARGFHRGRILLHFGAVDQIAAVTVNGREAGGHTGGYLPFSLDITGLVHCGTNTVAVEVTDTLDTDLPYGKQRRRRGGMWYTPVSGIWQPVWLESVPQDYIRSLRVTSTLDSVTIETEGGQAEKTVVIQTEGGERVHRYQGDKITISIENPMLWTPETPHLYPFVLSDGADRVESYFALRTVTVERVNGQAYICLNGKPRFFHGLLDQGYYSDGLYLPGSPEGYRSDILTMKKLGFDTLRKHVKVEPDLFYYYCDKYGMVVFQDLVNSGKYHYLRDTALPTVFRRTRRGAGHRASPKRRAQFEADARATAELLYNHPCVCFYTIFNEGWGQYDAGRLHDELKALDPTRIWNAASGWFSGEASDVTSEHVYFRKVELSASPEKPLVLSEFGGYSCKLPEHSFNLEKTYGYKKFEETEAYVRALERLYREEIIPAIGRGLCAAIYTQLSDVEDETNGLVTYDRQVVKVEQAPMVRLAAELRQAFEAHLAAKADEG